MDYANYRCSGRIYVVKKGDSLYKIAKENGITVNELMRANPYVNVYNMQVGEEICIPRSNQSPKTKCFRDIKISMTIKIFKTFIIITIKYM